MTLRLRRGEGQGSAQGKPFRQAQGSVGDRLRSLACRISPADTLERIVDPLIADLQFEHAKAVRAGRTWRARRVRLAGI